MKAPSGKAAKSKPKENPAITQDYPGRLTELEAELRLYPSRPAAEASLKAVEKPEDSIMGKEKVVQFHFGSKVYAAGHTDVTYSDSNHARGVRHIRLYCAGQAVLDIEGDYHDEQFGSNFRFQNIDLYVPGEWEPDFVKLTDQLRAYNTKRREAFKKKRLAAQGRSR